MESLNINNVIEIDDLNELAEKVEKPEDAANMIKQYEEILRTKRKDIISVAYHLGKVFSRFREKEKLVSKSGVHKNTIIFKINVFMLIDKYPKLMKSSVTLTFLKNCFKDMKKICAE